MGEGMVYGGLPFPGAGCPALDVVHIFWTYNINPLSVLSILVHLSKMFLSTDFIFQNGLDKLNSG